MTKFTFSRISSMVNAPVAINGVIAAIETALDTFLSRDGTSPNTMEDNLDMNSNRILNLPVPTTDLEPVRLIDLLNAQTGDFETTFDAIMQAWWSTLPTSPPVTTGIFWNDGGTLAHSE